MRFFIFMNATNLLIDIRKKDNATNGKQYYYIYLIYMYIYNAYMHIYIAMSSGDSSPEFYYIYIFTGRFIYLKEHP